jgi:hypothetical protein
MTFTLAMKVPDDVSDLLYLALLAANLVISAWILVGVTQKIANIKLPFGRAFLITFIGWLVAAVATFFVLAGPVYVAIIVGQLTTLVVIAGVASLMIKDENKTPISLGIAALVALLQALATLAVTCAILGVIWFFLVVTQK